MKIYVTNKGDMELLGAVLLRSGYSVRFARESADKKKIRLCVIAEMKKDGEENDA